MYDIVFLPIGLMDIVIDNSEITESYRDHLVQEIVVISADIDNPGPGRYLDQVLQEAGVTSFPAGVFLKPPAVDDITIQYEFFTGVVSQEIHQLLYLGISYAKVQVRNDDCFIQRNVLFHGLPESVHIIRSPIKSFRRTARAYWLFPGVKLRRQK